MPLTEEDNLAALGPKFRANALKVLNLQAKAQERGLSRGAQDSSARFDSAIGGVQAGLQTGLRQSLADQVVAGAADIGVKESQAGLQESQFSRGQDLVRSEGALNRTASAAALDKQLALERENTKLAKEAGEKAGIYGLIGAGLKVGTNLAGYSMGAPGPLF
jgi:hypothetical protein